jgi:hypothetical protein
MEFIGNLLGRRDFAQVARKMLPEICAAHKYCAIASGGIPPGKLGTTVPVPVPVGFRYQSG